MLRLWLLRGCRCLRSPYKKTENVTVTCSGSLFCGLRRTHLNDRWLWFFLLKLLTYYNSFSKLKRLRVVGTLVLFLCYKILVVVTTCTPVSRLITVVIPLIFCEGVVDPARILFIRVEQVGHVYMTFNL